MSYIKPLGQTLFCAVVSMPTFDTVLGFHPRNNHILPVFDTVDQFFKRALTKVRYNNESIDTVFNLQRGCKIISNTCKQSQFETIVIMEISIPRAGFVNSSWLNFLHLKHAIPNDETIKNIANAWNEITPQSSIRYRFFDGKLQRTRNRTRKKFLVT